MNTHIFNIDSRNRDTTKYENDSEFEYILSDNQSGKIKHITASYNGIKKSSQISKNFFTKN